MFNLKFLTKFELQIIECLLIHFEYKSIEIDN